eukprot:jgi/Chlat1/6814/Chrsp51S06501
MASVFQQSAARSFALRSSEVPERQPLLDDGSANDNQSAATIRPSSSLLMLDSIERTEETLPPPDLCRWKRVSMHEQDLALAKRRRQVRMYSTRDRWIIEPRSIWMRHWDLVMLLFLAYTAISCFLDTQWTDPLFWINRVVDLGFIMDIVFNFNLAYFDDDEPRAWIYNRRMVTMRYLKGDFAMDLISILPFDIVGVLVDQSSPARRLKALRAIRLIRLARVARMAQSARFFRRVKAGRSISYGALQLATFVVAAVVVAHWMACSFRLIADFETYEDSWIEIYFPKQADVSAISLYMVSLYWSTMTITTVGYGDVVPQTFAERLFVVLSMLFGAGVYAYVVGSLCGIITGLAKADHEFYALMDALRSFIKEARIEPELASRLRSYFQYRRRRTDVAMSPGLKGEVAIRFHSGWITDVDFFRGCPHAFFVELAYMLQSETFPPLETFINTRDKSDKMYIIRKGVVSCRGRLHTNDMVLGEDMVFGFVQRKYSARTLTFVDAYSIHRDDFIPLLEKFPEVQRHLRKEVARVVVKAQIRIFVNFVNRIQRHVKRGDRRAVDFLFEARDGSLGRLTLSQRLSAIEHALPFEGFRISKAILDIQRCFRGFRSRRRLHRKSMMRVLKRLDTFQPLSKHSSMDNVLMPSPEVTLATVHANQAQMMQQMQLLLQSVQEIKSRLARMQS